MQQPNKITILSDSNELTLKSNIKDILTYQYTKSETKLNQLLILTKEQLDKMIRMDIVKMQPDEQKHA